MPISIRSVIAIWIAGAALWAAGPCSAATIVDPSGDILSTYVGAVGPDLDILQFTAEIQADNLLFEVLLDGAPGTTAFATYVIGVDRGAGANTFPADFRLGASQDATISFRPSSLTGTTLLFEGGVPGAPTSLSSGAVTISGNTISVLVPLSMLPSTGFVSKDYTFLLWSRTPNPSAPQLGIADFAPNQGLLSLVPEPSTWAMMLLGFGAVGFMVRPSRKLGAPAMRRSL